MVGRVFRFISPPPFLPSLPSLGPCATCQETRTMEVNRVRDGVWGGAPPETTTVPPTVVEGMKK